MIAKTYFSKTAVLNRTHLFDIEHPLSLYQNWPFTKAGRIAYFGWLSADNFGDDILAEVARSELREFWIQSAYPRQRIEDILVCRIPKFRHNRANVIGGGTLIGGALGSVVRSAMDEKTPMFSFASGVLPLEKWRLGEKNAWREILRSATALSVRGHQSARMLQEVTQRSDIQVIGDYALAVSELYEPHPHPRALNQRPRVGLNLGSHSLFANTRHNEATRNAFAAMISKMSTCVDFVELLLHPIDKKLTRDAFIQAGVRPSSTISLFEKPTSVRELYKLDAVVSERLHGSILAHSYDVPSIGIGYNEKVFDHYEVMRQLDFFLPLNVLSADILTRKLERLLTEASEWIEKVRASRIELRQRQRVYTNMIRLSLC